jgi:hypothetical protein
MLFRHYIYDWLMYCIVVFPVLQSTPIDYLGHVAMKTAYVEETRGNVTLLVHGEYILKS